MQAKLKRFLCERDVLPLAVARCPPVPTMLLFENAAPFNSAGRERNARKLSYYERSTRAMIVEARTPKALQIRSNI